MKTPDMKKTMPPDFNPRCLVEAAVLMDRARKKGDKGFLAAAIDNNNKIWAHIHALAARPNHYFPKVISCEMTRLSNYVCSTTRNEGADINDMVLDTLINIDLQISEGLLYGNRH